MTEMHHVHQKGIFDPKNARPVVLMGAGSVGSFTALALAKAGIPLEVWDADMVVSYNAPMSLFGPGDIGRYKVDAVAEMIERLAGAKITAHREMYAGQKLANCSVVACVDTMEARKTIWQAARMNPSVDLYCDTRTAAAYVEVFCVEPMNRKEGREYEETLHKDSTVVPPTCGRHGIAYASLLAASAVAANLTTYWEDGKKKFWFAERADTFDRADVILM